MSRTCVSVCSCLRPASGRVAGPGDAHRGAGVPHEVVHLLEAAGGEGMELRRNGWGEIGVGGWGGEGGPGWGGGAGMNGRAVSFGEGW